MMQTPERTADRDAAIDAMLPLVPQLGWTMAALRQALTEGGGDARDAELLFPLGPADMVETFIDLSDRRMIAAAAERNIAALRVPERVHAVIALRLARNRPHREAVRRAAALMASPCHPGLAARCTARTVDAIWHAAGDRSADINWYTKRASLALVYSATLLFWLRDAGEDDSATLAFLGRRLEGVSRRVKQRRRLTGALARMLPGRAVA